MKYFVVVLFLSMSFLSFSQAVDSLQYNIGYTIGENIPVALLMAVGIFFLIRGFRRRGADKPEKTDFMNDGTIDK